MGTVNDPSSMDGRIYEVVNLHHFFCVHDTVVNETVKIIVEVDSVLNNLAYHP